MSIIETTIALLGKRARDKITGIEGPIVSVGFDLYGCVTAIIERGYDKDGKHIDNHWMDVQRLEVISDEVVIPVPAFHTRPELLKEYDHGAAEKPAPSR